MQFSESQKKAIEHFVGPAMVLAGPGSGKTLVITSRTRYLIEEKKVDPEHILVITFTRAAAAEMQQRFSKMCGGRHYRVSFGTFHAIFFQILKYAYHYTAASILKDEQQHQIMQELVRMHRLDFEDEKEMISRISAEISLVKNEQVPLEHYYSTSCPEDVFRDIYREYQQRLQSLGLIDFDDMLVYTWQLFRSRPDILAMWQKHFRFILVDEFQDINPLQYEIVKMLAKPEDNLFAVGDDDQSIYRFRGAKPEIMLNFRSVYPHAVFLVLQDNFRSDGRIVRASQQVIRSNKNRYEKNIVCTHADGEPVEIRRMKTQESEALYILKSIRDGMAEEKGRTFAVLTRTNTGGRYIAERLMEFNIPFEMKDRIPNLYDHWIAKDIFAYIRLGQGAGDRNDLLLIMNRPLRYISRDCVESSDVDFDKMRLYYGESGRSWMNERIDKLEDDLAMLRDMAPYAAVNWIRKGIGYDDFLKEYAEKRKLDPADLSETLDELQEAAKPFRTAQEWSDHIKEYTRMLEEQKNSRRQEAAGGRKQPAVTLSTFHGAKGLEFDEVYLPDVNEGVIPHRKAVLETDIEEERRLLYVGMTRARKKLHIFFTRERYGKEQEPSRFLDVFHLPA